MMTNGPGEQVGCRYGANLVAHRNNYSEEAETWRTVANGMSSMNEDYLGAFGRWMGTKRTVESLDSLLRRCVTCHGVPEDGSPQECPIAMALVDEYGTMLGYEAQDLPEMPDGV